MEPTKTDSNRPSIPVLSDPPEGVGAWRQAKALRLRERRVVMVERAHSLIQGENLTGAQAVISQIMEIDGEILGLEERP